MGNLDSATSIGMLRKPPLTLLIRALSPSWRASAPQPPASASAMKKKGPAGPARRRTKSTTIESPKWAAALRSGSTGASARTNRSISSPSGVK